MEEILKVQDLTLEIRRNFKYYPALRDVSFSINSGEIIGLVGESGCGKSITSLAIMGLLPKVARIKSGEITLGGKCISEMKSDDMASLRGSSMSMIFQDPMTALNPLITIGKQVEEAYVIHNSCSREEAYAKTIAMMRKAGLAMPEKLYKQYPHEPSGGMRQRVMIAMALINEPDLIIADEPTTALDVTIQYQILQLIKKLNEEYNSAVMLVSHDLGIIREVCTRVIVMYAGFIVEEGSIEEILENPYHPYTKGLIACIPTPDKKGRELKAVPGVVPPLQKREEGICPFFNRCSEADDSCRKGVPELRILKDRKVRCFKVSMVDEDEER